MTPVWKEREWRNSGCILVLQKSALQSPTAGLGVGLEGDAPLEQFFQCLLAMSAS